MAQRNGVYLDVVWYPLSELHRWHTGFAPGTLPDTLFLSTFEQVIGLFASENERLLRTFKKAMR